jgi:hypothetical protein
VVGQPLCAIAFIAFADSHEEHAVASPGEFRSEVNRAHAPGVGYEEVFDVGQRGAVGIEPPAR